MKITSIKAYVIRIPLTEEFRIALGASRFHEGVITEIHTDEGIIGYGEGVPSRRITGETLDSTASLISRVGETIVGRDPLDYRDIIHGVENSILGNTAAKASIDLALFDIVSKSHGLPLKAFLGKKSGNRFETSITIGIMDKKHAVEKAFKLVEMGARILKIKIGLDPSSDVERVLSIRKAVGEDIKIRLDANQGYTPKQAIRVLRRLENADIEFCEQPVHWRDLDGMRHVRVHTEIPIMADESVHSPRDVIDLIRHDAADMVNIKIMKAGGILNAIKIADICEAAGLVCQIGCMSETRIAIAAGLHLAIALDIIKYSDLDGYMLLKEDIASGVEFADSANIIGGDPGLGVHINRASLEKHSIKTISLG